MKTKVSFIFPLLGAALFFIPCIFILFFNLIELFCSWMHNKRNAKPKTPVNMKTIITHHLSRFVGFFHALDAKSIAMLLAAAILATAIVIAAVLLRQPRYKSLGHQGLILDTHTGGASYWTDAPPAFHK